MAKRARAEEPMYRVWRPELGETFDEGTEYGALDAQCAARLYAEFGANHRSWESFPVIVHVQNSLTGVVVVVQVDREMVPEYIAGRPVPLRMEPATHALWGGRAVCEDIRLDFIPANWPPEQRWIDVREWDRFVSCSPKRCQVCAKRAPGLLEGLKAIGARK